MAEIQFTNGRKHERENGERVVVEDADLSNLKSIARQLLSERRKNGLPDGYLIFDDAGRQVAEEWVRV